MYSSVNEDAIITLLSSGIVFVFAIIACIINGLTIYFMAKKAGIDKPWLSFIPIVQFIPFFRIIKKSPWSILLAFIPIVNAIMSIIWAVELLRAFDRNTAMVLLMIFIPGFSFFYYLYLGLSKDVRYVY